MTKFTLILVPLTFLFFNISICNAQNQKKKADDSFELLKPLSAYDSIGLINLPKLTLAESFKGESLPDLPSVVDNSTEIYWRPVFAQVGLECGQASGVGLGFTYAINRLRNLSGSLEENQYPTHFVWNFGNGGNGWYGVSYFHSFEIIKTLGTPNVTTYGGMISPSPYTMWMTGYDNYYQAMNNRISDVYQIDVSSETGIETLKHWIHNNLEGSNVGGVANFYSTSPSASITLPAGTPEEGKYVKISWSGSNHSMTICGYNDSICWDYNNDGQYTNHIDITGDGIVNASDWEVGGFKFANTYNGGPSWGNDGFCYMTYNSLADDSYGGSGLWNNAVHIVYPKENCTPQLTAKITLKHNRRNQIRVRMGVSTDQTSETPEYIIGFPVFDFQGGGQYMQGGDTNEDHKTIEFGLDLSPLLNLIGSNLPARYFLLVDEADPNGWGQGQIIQFSIIDYTSGINEIVCPQSNVNIVNDTLTKIWVDHNVIFNEPSIDDDVLPDAALAEQYSHQLNATGGAAPYYWDFDLNFNEINFTGAFPSINTLQLSPSNNNDGYAFQNLDFSFPFYDNEYSQVRVYVDGYIMFEDQFSWPYSVYDFFDFTKNKYIAPFMADLEIFPADNDGMWYEGDANNASFRWKVAVADQAAATELNFAVRLSNNGDIRFYYGSVNNFDDMEWISGLSAGDNIYYQFLEISNDQAIPGNYVSNLTASKRPVEFTVNHDGMVEGLPEIIYDSLKFKVRATDENNIKTSREVFISSAGSFLKIDSVIISSGGDDIIEYGETAYLTVIVKCLGNEAIAETSMELLIDDEYITLLDSSEVLGNFSPGEFKTFTTAFSFDVSNSIPNNYVLDFLGPINDNSGHEWVNTFQLNAFAPDISIGSISVVDGNNNILDPGENCDLEVNLSNSGGSSAYNLNTTLSTTDLHVNIINNTASLPSLSSNGTGVNTFNITVTSDILIGHILDFALDIEADQGIATTLNFSLEVGQSPILIVDMDPDHSSAPFMETALSSLGIHYDIATSIPALINTYSGIFVCLGIYSDNYTLQEAEGIQLANFLNNGGCLYMEGGDTWAYDNQTTAHDMFNIDGVADGTADMGTVIGQTGTFTEGMSFNYSGQNNYMDHIAAIAPAFLLFQNESPSYGTAVAYDAGTYKTIGAGHEFGGLDDDIFPSTKEELFRLYLEFFDLLPTLEYSLDLKVALEGPFNGTEMSTQLKTNNLIPLHQPFNQYPWFYEGTENLSSLPNSDIVDWLLVELRDTTDASLASSETVIHRQAAFLLKDGSIVHWDGTSRLQFNNVLENQLYVAIWHRNHLGVISANALVGFNDIYYYDFTTNENRVLGGNLGHKEISSGVWGLISGDGNCDGHINMTDLSTVWSSQAGQSVYELGDFNLDGNIDNKDKDDMYIINEGYDSQVPE